MAFEYQGTQTTSQLARFKAYVQNQLELVDARIAHLKAERDRVGNLAFAYDSGGNPTAFTEDTPETYCGKLYSAYVALGGDPEFDLQIRSTSQPVWRLEGDEVQDSQLMSNGEVLGVQGLSDEESSLLMQETRSWVQGDIQRRRDSLERKMRRAVDYAENLTAEISQLQIIKGDEQVDGSLVFLFKELDALASNPQYLAITDDAGTDPHGKTAKAPMASYMPGPNSTVTSIQRTYDGVVKPQE